MTKNVDESEWPVEMSYVGCTISLGFLMFAVTFFLNLERNEVFSGSIKWMSFQVINDFLESRFECFFAVSTSFISENKNIGPT